jgi:serine/threonine-protein kinase HipA
VTTTAYLPADAMALTLNGSTRWPTQAQLQGFGETRQIGAPASIRAILERIATAMAETIPEIEAYTRDHPGFAEIGARMIAAWRESMSDAQG